MGLDRRDRSQSCLCGAQALAPAQFPWWAAGALAWEGGLRVSRPLGGVQRSIPVTRRASKPQGRRRQPVPSLDRASSRRRTHGAHRSSGRLPIGSETGGRIVHEHSRVPRVIPFSVLRPQVPQGHAHPAATAHPAWAAPLPRGGSREAGSDLCGQRPAGCPARGSHSRAIPGVSLP